MHRMCLLATAAVALTGSAARADYTFGGIAGGQGWTWDGQGMTAYRNAMQNPANFGPGGVVGAPVSTTTISSLSPSNLATINCFVSPANGNGQYSAGDVQNITNFFLAGGDLLLLCDDQNYDAIAAALNVPSTGAGLGVISASTTGVNPLSSGPFGSVSVFNQAYLVGWLNASDVAAKNGHVAAVNANGVAAAYWDRGEYAPGAGKLVIITDVDTLAGNNNGYPGMAQFGVNNANAVLALNTTAFFVVPTPGVLAFVMVPTVVAVRRRRR